MEAVDDPSKFKADVLRAHNQYRAIHDSPPLRMDEKLNEWAQQLAIGLSKKGAAARDEVTPPHGENVYVGLARYPSWKMQPEEPVQYWYEEHRDYNYDTPAPRNLTHVRNFSQLVWKDSRSMGVGIAADPSGTVYLVCRYDPPGNIEGEFQRNVTPPKEDDHAESSEDPPLMAITELPAEETRRSIERLYAVPSEKLRVEMARLTGICEIVDEWYKWVQLHADLIARIAETIADSSREERKIESAADAKSDEIPDNTAPATKVKAKKRNDASRDFFTGTDGGETATANEKAERAATSWPIGTRWRPLTPPIEREADQMETIRRLEVPRDNAEMIKLLKNFAHQAALYRSYYKRWMKPVDQLEGITEDAAAGGKLAGETAEVDKDVPYFSSLKAALDMDIAIPRNDEKVIPLDIGRESISANRRYLYFNLSDKPGDGQPCL